MAVAGSAVPTLKVWLENGALKSGFSMHANSAVVVEDVMEVATRIRAGEQVLMLRQGWNVAILSFVIQHGLYARS